MPFKALKTSVVLALFPIHATLRFLRCEDKSSQAASVYLYNLTLGGTMLAGLVMSISLGVYTSMKWLEIVAWTLTVMFTCSYILIMSDYYKSVVSGRQENENFR